MGRITRHDIANLLEKFEDTQVSIDTIKQQYQRSEGPPSVLLRDMARVLKHFEALPLSEENTKLTNTALSSVAKGVDPTKAIKRARIECQKPGTPKRQKDLVRN